MVNDKEIDSMLNVFLEAGIIHTVTEGLLTDQCVDDGINRMRNYYHQLNGTNTLFSLSFNIKHLSVQNLPHILRVVRFFCEVEEISSRLLKDVSILCTENAADILHGVFTYVRMPRRPTAITTATRTRVYSKEMSAAPSPLDEKPYAKQNVSSLDNMERTEEKESVENPLELYVASS